MAKKVLVTGGAGFIGSHVADELIKLGYSVVVLDDLSGGFRENVNKEARFVKDGVTDTRLIKNRTMGAIVEKYSKEASEGI